MVSTRVTPFRLRGVGNTACPGSRTLRYWSTFSSRVLVSQRLNRRRHLPESLPRGGFIATEDSHIVKKDVRSAATFPAG
jgi:hypothetical protein